MRGVAALCLAGALAGLVDGCAPTDAKAEELREFCKTQIAPFKAPREIEFVSELPRTGLGKVAKLALRDKFAG